MRNYILTIKLRYPYSWELVYTVGVMTILFFMGLLVFNKTEKRFIDTV